MLCRKSCYEIFTKYRSGAGSCISKIARMYLFTDILKTEVTELQPQLYSN